MLEAFFANQFAVFAAILLASFGGYIAWRNNLKSRQALAAAAFRTSILAAVADVPDASEHWGNEFLASLQSRLSTMGLAIATFAPFLNPISRRRFLQEWQTMRKHSEETLPKVLSAAEIHYGGAPAALQAKREFHAQVKDLLSHAQQT
jgi:hypothetical protein